MLFKLGGEKGPFDPDQPVVGAIRLGAVFAVLLCLATRQQVDSSTPRTTLINRGAMGPMVGGILLIGIGGFIALDVPSQAVLALLAVAAVLLVALRFILPPLGALARRALVTPYVVVAAGLYWTIIESVVGTPGAAEARRQASLDPHLAMVALALLVVFSGVYYAMLVFAPRQIADREGGPVEWLVRYVAFVASIALGAGWLGALST